MKKLSEVSKRLDAILKVCFWVIVVSCAIVTVVFSAFALIPALTEQITGTWSVTLGNVELVLAETMNENISFLRAEAITNVLVVAISAAFFCYGIKILRKILGCMSECRPFDGTVSCNMKKLGNLIVLASVVLNVAGCVGAALIYKACNLTELLLSDTIVAVNTDFYLVDAKTLFLGVLVILLSYVFKYGEELQQQADETL